MALLVPPHGREYRVRHVTPQFAKTGISHVVPGMVSPDTRILNQIHFITSSQFYSLSLSLIVVLNFLVLCRRQPNEPKDNSFKTILTLTRFLSPHPGVLDNRHIHIEHTCFQLDVCLTLSISATYFSINMGTSQTLHYTCIAYLTAPRDTLIVIIFMTWPCGSLDDWLSSQWINDVVLFQMNTKSGRIVIGRLGQATTWFPHKELVLWEALPWKSVFKDISVLP